MANINIGGRLHSTASGNVVAGANEILDDSNGKKQSVINQETGEALAGKQATIEDLSTIRSGAAAGATAYQKPGTGIPKTDLAEAVQTSLGKADTAYQKPSGGIPASDIASGVIPAISTNIGTDGSSDSKVASPKAVKTYVDNKVNGIVGFDSVTTPSPADGTAVINLSNGNTITLDLNHNHDSYYSKVVGTAQPSGGFLPDVAYNLGTVTGTVTFALAAPVNGQLNHYFWMFSTGGTAPTITWPTVTWAAGSAPTVAANKKYEISILNGVAYYSEM